MTFKERHRVRAASMRAQSRAPQKWPETMAELYSRPPSNLLMTADEPRTVSTLPALNEQRALQELRAQRDQQIQQAYQAEQDYLNLQATGSLLNSPNLSQVGQTAPMQNKSFSSTPPTFSDPDPAPGPPPQPEPEYTNPHHSFGFADPGLLAAQQAQAKQAEQAQLDQQELIANTQHGRPGNSGGGTPKSNSSGIYGWTEWDVPEADRKRWNNTHDSDYYTSEYDYMDLTPSDQSKTNPYGIDIDNFLHWAYSQVGYHEKEEEKNLNAIGDTGGHANWTKYGDWYGINGDYTNDDGSEHLAPWCAMFAAWSAQKAGISKDIIPRYSSTYDYIKWYDDPSRQRFMPKETYKPKAGDMILYRWKENGAWQGHTGIVVAYSVETDKDGIEKEYVYTIEGNLEDKVEFRQVPLDKWNLVGFGMNGGSSNGIVPPHYITEDGKMN